jgi:hypothetical protein
MASSPDIVSTVFGLQECYPYAIEPRCPKLKILSYTAQIRQFEPDSEVTLLQQRMNLN